VGDFHLLFSASFLAHSEKGHEQAPDNMVAAAGSPQKAVAAVVGLGDRDGPSAGVSNRNKSLDNGIGQMRLKPLLRKSKIGVTFPIAARGTCRKSLSLKSAVLVLSAGVPSFIVHILSVQAHCATTPGGIHETSQPKVFPPSGRGRSSAAGGVALRLGADAAKAKARNSSDHAGDTERTDS
jgi:hypothetical protein